MKDQFVYLFGFALFFGCLGFSDCKGSASSELTSEYGCLHMPVSASPAVSVSGPEPVATTSQGLFAKAGALWTVFQIPVCWDSFAPADAANRAIVQQAVSDTWNTVLAWPGLSAGEQFQFTGWGQCNGASSGGVRITVQDTVIGPHTMGLGNEIAGMSGGMVLNFTFQNWSPDCADSESERQGCIRAIAVHEFGHALGMAHEQNRPDTPKPPECDDAPQGENGNLLLGPWDLDSVMNYCNPKWNNAGQLSQGDRLGIQAVYYPLYFDPSCLSEAALSDGGGDSSPSLSN